MEADTPLKKLRSQSRRSWGQFQAKPSPTALNHVLDRPIRDDVGPLCLVARAAVAIVVLPVEKCILNFQRRLKCPPSYLLALGVGEGKLGRVGAGVGREIVGEGRKR